VDGISNMTILQLFQYIIVTVLALWLGTTLVQRLQLSLAKSPGLNGHLRWAKRISGWIKGYSYKDDAWFTVDGAPDHISKKRKIAFHELSLTLKTRSPNTLAMTAQAKPLLSDLAAHQSLSCSLSVSRGH
jgi:hypothetical protein